MSVVSNVIRSFGICERELGGNNYERADRIDQWLKDSQYMGLGQDLGQWDGCGGQRKLETPIFVGAFNYLDHTAFIRFVFSLPWDAPENVQVLIQGQDDNVFTIYSLCPNQSLHPGSLE